jgi:hypothetical protein
VFIISEGDAVPEGYSVRERWIISHVVTNNEGNPYDRSYHDVKVTPTKVKLLFDLGSRKFVRFPQF